MEDTVIPSKQGETFRDRIVELVRVPGGTLLANPKNWRTHPQRQRNALLSILREIGIAGAVLGRRDADGTIVLIDGHLRDELIVHQEVPVLLLDVTEEEADKILLTFDPIGEMATAGKKALEELAASATFGEDPLRQLVEDLASKHGITLGVDGGLAKDAPVDLNQSEKLAKKWKTEAGQIWAIGKHRLGCGDSTSKEFVDQIFDGAKPNLMITDPPYGVNYDAEWRDNLDGGQRAKGKIANDHTASWAEVWKLFPGDVAYIWCSGLHQSVVMADLASADLEIRAQIIWSKQHAPISRGAYHWKHEPCWYAVRKGGKAHWIGDRKQTTVWDISNANCMGGGKRETEHPSEKPLECMLKPIRNHDGDVFEPFAGSGTTLVAAENAGRSCYAIELDPGYVACILERLAGLGLEPKLTNAATKSTKERKNRSRT